VTEYSVLLVINSRYMSKGADRIRVLVAFFYEISAIRLVSLKLQRKGMSSICPPRQEGFDMDVFLKTALLDHYSLKLPGDILAQ
jgi:hypothetical protein